jgi:hypothetical protein
MRLELMSAITISTSAILLNSFSRRLLRVTGHNNHLPGQGCAVNHSTPRGTEACLHSTIQSSATQLNFSQVKRCLRKQRLRRAFAVRNGSDGCKSFRSYSGLYVKL